MGTDGSQGNVIDLRGLGVNGGSIQGAAGTWHSDDKYAGTATGSSRRAAKEPMRPSAVASGAVDGGWRWRLGTGRRPGRCEGCSAFEEAAAVTGALVSAAAAEAVDVRASSMDT